MNYWTNKFKQYNQKYWGGKLSNINVIVKPFNGEVCDVCYYEQYNEFLNKLKDKPNHKEFL